MMNAFFLSSFLRATLLFVLTYCVYLLTMMPDIGFTDSGELAAVAHTLGIAHPTGYPLYTILTHVWSVISPFSTVYDLNLFAALTTALSISVFSLILDEALSITNSDKKYLGIISLCTALTFGFGSTVWSQATALEVYSLQLLLFMLSIYFFIKAMKHGGMSNHLLIWGFLIGLSFTNHGTTILLAPAMIIGYFSDWKTGKFQFTKDAFRGLLPIIPLFMCGLLIWLYLPMRSAQGPIVNWGEVHRNWDAFSYHAFGKQYQVWMFNEGTAKDNFPKYWSALIGMTSWIILLPIAFGVYSAWKANKSLCIFSIMLILGNLAYALNYGIHDIETYFISGFIGAFILAAFGLHGLIKGRMQFQYALLILPLFNLGMNYTENDKHADTSVPSYIKLMIDPLPKNAVIISSQWDYLCSGFLYKQIVEGYRPDIIMVEKELLRRTWFPIQLKRQYPFLGKVDNQFNAFLVELQKFELDLPYSAEVLQSRYLSVMNAMIDSAIAYRRPVFITTEVLQSEPNLAQSYAKVPQGLAFRIMLPPPSGLPEIPLELLNADFETLIQSTKGKSNHLYKGLTSITANQVLNLAQYAWMTGRLKEANRYLDIAESLDSDNQTLYQLRQAIIDSPEGPQSREKR
ncbi:MAG: DUF2723 domain-containing protein [Candidatus Kapaibacteriota bacterium]